MWDVFKPKSHDFQKKMYHLDLIGTPSSPCCVFFSSPSTPSAFQHPQLALMSGGAKPLGRKRTSMGRAFRLTRRSGWCAVWNQGLVEPWLVELGWVGCIQLSAPCIANLVVWGVCSFQTTLGFRLANVQEVSLQMLCHWNWELASSITGPGSLSLVVA